ncbi:RHS repeat-associated protein [Dysgonomonas sp. PFB1-18]|uniref:RHS repeat domain-containing protein n=1 Tax=unclassified Dysgonomonas TaxID=2630389 RepID=UPI0024756259|nr:MULTISPECIES: RHS repeat-associated core domain-containing protein [unclassified Dysgonomonas]MDH6310474.1 RHS repeat-associated protein [Dysgonomonas sp. PF1-14]MDH6340912.1 RHS repeat-associated protein [Dysgonomonas sp. PF1-16]MDH6382673.1 RHS repeat-associated protein [Dysgonomonas sp. PFB1-18]MDH6399893.1 RHS repeat-associated protein [Dysgonomonas sp. PF1-23]
MKLRTVHLNSTDVGYTPVLGSTSGDANFDKRITTDYVGNIIYEQDALKRILIDGGYIEGGLYYFYVNDHLGNNRVVVGSDGQRKQQNHYYPFGMTFADSFNPDIQPYKYNGKELEKTHELNMYDYSARYYDPALGRFTTVDPLAEEYYSISPYVYVMNNPLKYIDPDGRKIIGTNGKPVGLVNGKLTSNAPKDLQRVGTAMLRSRTATRSLMYLLNHKKDITLSISSKIKTEKEGGKTATVLGETSQRMTVKNGELEVKGFDIVLYEGSIKKTIEQAKKDNQPKDVKDLDGLSVDEVLAVTAGHEQGHTTPENVQLSTEGKVGKVEIQPKSIEKQIIKELQEIKKRSQ